MDGTKRHGITTWWYRHHRWMYRDGRPNRLARLENRISSALFALGLVGLDRVAVLRVAGRRTGRALSCPVVVARHGDERYLVAMLGENTNWVHNVRAAGGRAELRHGRREHVTLREVDPADRAPILRAYLDVAPGARPHVPVDRHAPLAEFERIAPAIPVFRIADDLPADTTG